MIPARLSRSFGVLDFSCRKNDNYITLNCTRKHRAKASQLKWNTFLYSRGRCRHAHRNVVLFVFVDLLNLFAFISLAIPSHPPIRADVFILREHSRHTLILNVPNSALAGALLCFQMWPGLSFVLHVQITLRLKGPRAGPLKSAPGIPSSASLCLLSLWTMASDKQCPQKQVKWG